MKEIHVLLNDYNMSYYTGKTYISNGEKYLKFGDLKDAKKYSSEQTAERAVWIMKANPNLSGTEDLVATTYLIEEES